MYRIVHGTYIAVGYSSAYLILIAVIFFQYTDILIQFFCSYSKDSKDAEAVVNECQLVTLDPKPLCSSVLPLNLSSHQEDAVPIPWMNGNTCFLILVSLK